MKCPAGSTESASVILRQAYSPNLILGSSTSVDPVIRSEETAANQRNDLRITFVCPGYWRVEGVENPTFYTKEEQALLETDPMTCQPIKQNRTKEEQKVFEGLAVRHD